MNKNFKFSIIIPIYNVGNYLDETINSLICQTIGFEDNIQVILINDGSKDNSESICLKYKEMYPNNFIYYKQKNAGVSAARNKGLEFATGELVNFFDGDDKWEKCAFKEVYSKSKKNKNVNIFSCELLLFDAQKGRHPLYYKYIEDKVVDVNDEYNYPQLNTSSVFFRLETIKKYKYTVGIKYAEDCKMVSEILLDESKIMMLKKPKYYYRKRNNGTSAIQTQTADESLYLNTPINVFKYLYDLSETKCGKIKKFIQYVFIYDLSWKISYNAVSPLNGSQKKQYSDILYSLISRTDDDVILSHAHLDIERKMFLLGIKYKKDIKKMIKFASKDVIFNKSHYNIEEFTMIYIDKISLRDKGLKFNGRLNLKYINKNDFKIMLNGKNVFVEYYKLGSNMNIQTFNGESVFNYTGIEFVVPLNNESWNLNFYVKNLKIFPKFEIGGILSENLVRSYHHIKNRTLVLKNGTIYNYKRNIFKSFHYEFLNEKQLLLSKNIKSLLIRLYTKISRLFKRKEIWLISDRVNRADDNGEHFYKYMLKNHPDKKIYYILSSSSIDYPRLKKIGKVIDYTSLKYKLIFNNADFVVSSHAENYLVNPMGKKGVFTRDQYRFKYVFLQHGVIKDDLSPWLNVNTKRIDMFVTSSVREYKSMFEYNYRYDRDIVKLTGLPRFDGLIEMQENIKPKKLIMMSFTWRNSLSTGYDRVTGEKIYNPKFKESDYFKYINKILNDEKLFKVLDKKGYKIRFIPHPNVLTQINDFDINDKYVEFEKNNINYQEEFCKSKLMITDYSSVYFDFGYLKKTVIYYQHDRDSFFESQIYQKGYFDYDTMGFGPCFSDYDSFINELIKMIENDCVLENKYLKRMNSTFKFDDNKNCERVYDEIKKLK